MKTKEQIGKRKEAAKIEAEFEAERTTIPPEEPKRRRGRPETRVLKLNVSSPEEAFRQIFAAADPPDPSKRVVNKPKK